MPQTFVADENLDWPIVVQLRLDGHTVFAIAESSPGISDDEVLAVANARNAILVTADKDFGELVHRQHRLAAGIVLVRLAGLPPSAKAQLVANVVRQFGETLRAAFTVVTPTSVRHRPQRKL